MNFDKASKSGKKYFFLAGGGGGDVGGRGCGREGCQQLR